MASKCRPHAQYEIRVSDIETRMKASGAPKPDLRYSIYIPGTKIEKRTAYIFLSPGKFLLRNFDRLNETRLDVRMKSE